MFRMSEEAKLNIERVVGLSVEQINALTLQEEIDWVENRTKKRVMFSKQRRRGIIGRGNPLLARRKICTFADLDKKSKKYIGI